MISSTTRLWSPAASCRHTLRLLAGRMFGPPGLAISLEGCNQFFKSKQRQQRRLRPWCRRQAGAGNGDENVLASEHLNSAVPGLVG